MAAARVPPDAAVYGLPRQVECPFCEQPDKTELHSAFGPQLSVATYWCTRCHTAFEFLKWSPANATSSDA
jgi:hypothetical protein